MARVNYKLIFRISLLIIIPTFIYLWLFSSINPYNYQFKKRDKTMVLDDNCPSLKCSFRQVLNIPFRSDYYEFCFVDSSNSQSYPYNAQLANGEKMKIFNITSEGRYCEIVNLKFGIETLVQEGSNNFDIWEVIRKNKTIVIENGIRDIESKIKPEFWSGITKLLLTFLAFWIILFLLREVKKYFFESFKRVKQ